MEYGGAIWDSYLQKDKDKLAKINRRAARFVANDYERQSSVTAVFEEIGMAISRTTSSESTFRHDVQDSSQPSGSAVSRTRAHHNFEYKTQSKRLRVNDHRHKYITA